MANFQYTNITGSIRDAAFEARLEKIGADEAAVLAGLAGVTDVGEDGDFDVTSDAAYTELYDQSIGFWKRVK